MNKGKGRGLGGRVRSRTRSKNMIMGALVLSIIIVGLGTSFIIRPAPSEGSDVGWPIVGLDASDGHVPAISIWSQGPRHYVLNGNTVNDLRWSPDGSMIAIATFSNELAIIDVNTWPDYRAIRFENGFVTSVAWSPDGKYLAVANIGNDIWILDSRDWSTESVLRYNDAGYTMSVDFSPDGLYLAAGHGRSVTLWSTVSWNVYESHLIDDDYGENVTRVVWSPDGTMLTYVYDRGQRIVRTDNWEQILNARYSIETCWSPNSSIHVCTGDTGIANVNRIENYRDRVVRTLYAKIRPRTGHDVTDAAWAPNGSVLATSKTDGGITIWDPITWDRVQTIPLKIDNVTQLDWNPNSTLLASGDDEMNIWFWRPEPISLLRMRDGPQLFAGYRENDITIAIDPSWSPQLPTKVVLVLDPDGANVTLGCDLSVEEPNVTVMNDKRGYVRLATSPSDVEIDEVNATARLHFRVEPNWNWPHEDMCACLVKITWEPWINNDYYFSSVFNVENDVMFHGDLTVLGEWQGMVEEGGWVRAGERVTVTGPIVVYEGTTDVYPEHGAFSVTLEDDDGDAASSPVLSGEPLEVTFGVDDMTDLDELLTLGLKDLPGEAALVSERTFAIRIDGDTPTFSGAIPDPDTWQGSSTVLAAITVTDTGTSGVLEGSLAYSLATEGPLVGGDWTSAGLEMEVHDDGVDGLVALSLPEGERNYLRWLVKDLVGNVNVSDDLRILVDSRNVTFSDHVPSDEGWHYSLGCECGVTIMDIEGSGIDVSTIQYRWSLHNISSYGIWTDWEEGDLVDADEVSTRVMLEFGSSSYNYIQWRAMDLAGNGFTASSHYRIKIDFGPIEFVSFSPSPNTVHTLSQVICRVLVADRGGSGIDLGSMEYKYQPHGGQFSQWSSTGHEGIVQADNLTITVPLSDGFENRIQFRGFDVAGNGPSVSEEYSIAVDTIGPEFSNITLIEDPYTTNRTVTFEISDALTGVDTLSIRYRCGLDDGFSTSWEDVQTEPTNNGYTGSVNLSLVKGHINHASIKGSDLVGNERIVEVVRQWVNTPPTAVIFSPVEGHVMEESESLLLSAMGSSDAEDDELDIIWVITSQGTLMDTSDEPETRIQLPPGSYVIQLTVSDDDGDTDRAQANVTVEALPPPEYEEESQSLFIIILVVLLLTIIGVGVYLTHRFGSKQSR